MTCDSREFFKLFFHELESRSIPYVILHSYQELPDQITSDIDFAVPAPILPQLRNIQFELARKHGWGLVQTFQHGVFAYYSVLVNLEDPSQNLRLDACASYARIRRLLVPEKILLGNRVPYRGFYIPAPAVEFIYVITKLFDAKKKSPARYVPRLKELWSQDPATAEAYFRDAFGDTCRTLAQWFETPPEEWRKLGAILYGRNGFGPGLLLKESVRVMKRVFQPTGFCVAVLGSDGSGKSTLLGRMQTLLHPCFRHERLLHFRPGVLQKRTPGPVNDPHGRPARNVVSSWLKVLYYFADHWAGWLAIVVPGKIRSTLVIFDRHFDDLLVDEKRYRLRGTNLLVRVLRKLLPGPDRTYVLAAPPEVLHRRKPELTLPELARQQDTLRKLVINSPRYLCIRAEQTPDEVAQAVGRDVTQFLAAREAKRLR